MQKLLALSTALLLTGFVCLTQAQVPLTGAGLGKPAAGAAYTGPGDCSGCATGALFWIGLRAYSAAKIGAAVANVCDNAMANCADFVTDGSGVLVFQTLGANNCAATGTCLVKKLYDQSGGTNCSAAACDFNIHATFAGPKLTPNCLGALACMTFGTTVLMDTAGTLTQAQPVTISMVASANASDNLTFAGSNLFGTGIVMLTGSLARLSAGGSSSTISLASGTFHGLQAVLNAGSSDFNINGSANAVGTPGTSGSSNIVRFGDAAFLGRVMESGVWPSAFSGGQSTAMNTNQQAYWGF